jgi:mannose-6-phosphate isomerase-like protein (cupin superfamily)
MKISLAAATQQLSDAGQRFVELFQHGSLSIELYRPVGQDLQQPHRRDELYVIASGSGIFLHGEVRMDFVVGDVLFVPAGIVHRFEVFSEDFSTWVFFYGPEGGESA